MEGGSPGAVLGSMDRNEQKQKQDRIRNSVLQNCYFSTNIL